MKKIQCFLKQLLCVTALLPVVPLNAAAHHHGARGYRPPVVEMPSRTHQDKLDSSHWLHFVRHHPRERQKALAYFATHYDQYNYIYAGKTMTLLNEFPTLNVNFLIDGMSTPLSHACAHGRLTIINKLLDRGANPALKDYLGNSPIDDLERAYNWRGKRDWNKRRDETLARMRAIIAHQQ